jgi:hypothetical protein
MYYTAIFLQTACKSQYDNVELPPMPPKEGIQVYPKSTKILRRGEQGQAETQKGDHIPWGDDKGRLYNPLRSYGAPTLAPQNRGQAGTSVPQILRIWGRTGRGWGVVAGIEGDCSPASLWGLTSPTTGVVGLRFHPSW